MSFTVAYSPSSSSSSLKPSYSAPHVCQCLSKAFALSTLSSSWFRSLSKSKGLSESILSSMNRRPPEPLQGRQAAAITDRWKEKIKQKQSRKIFEEELEQEFLATGEDAVDVHSEESVPKDGVQDPHKRKKKKPKEALRVTENTEVAQEVEKFGKRDEMPSNHM